MKDYIYLDQELLNSTLAQIDDGLNTKIQSQINSSSNGSKVDSETSSASLSGGFSGFLHTSIKQGNSSGTTKGFTHGQSEMIDTVLHDAAVDYVIDKLTNSFVTDASAASEGSHVYLTETYRIYDFELISKITAPDYAPTYSNLDKVHELESIELEIARLHIAKSQNKNAQTAKLNFRKLELENEIYGAEGDGFDTVHQATKMMDVLFPNTIYFRTPGSAILGDRSNFHINSAQIQTIATLDRKIKIVGIVTGIQKQTHSDGEFEELKSTELNLVPSMMIDVMLSSFDMLESNDRFIKPIAIFFED